MDWDVAIKKRYAVLTPLLDERSRRLLVAAESQVIGRSGTAVVSKVTGVSRRVIRQGIYRKSRSCIRIRRYALRQNIRGKNRVR